MQAELLVLPGVDVSVVQSRYPEIVCTALQEWEPDRARQVYCLGRDSDDDHSAGSEWLTFSECVEFAGFCEGAMPESEVRIEGCDRFVKDSIRKGDHPEWKEYHDIYWAAVARGQNAR